MYSREIRKQRCEDALKVLTDGGFAVFFTLTTPDEVGYNTIRERWRLLRHDLLQALRREGKKPQYVMNYELHPGYLQKMVSCDNGEIMLRSDGHPHGWHIHGVISCFVPLREFRSMLYRFGFGRVDVRKVTTLGVAEYLTKHALKAYRGLTQRDKQVYKGLRLRLVNTSRGLPPLSDYAYCSDLIKRTKDVMQRARANELELRANGEDLERPNYRIMHQYSNIAAMLQLQETWQVKRLCEMAQQAQVAKMLQWIEEQKEKQKM